MLSIESIRELYALLTAVPASEDPEGLTLHDGPEWQQYQERLQVLSGEIALVLFRSGKFPHAGSETLRQFGTEMLKNLMALQNENDKAAKPAAKKPRKKAK